MVISCHASNVGEPSQQIEWRNITLSVIIPSKGRCLTPPKVEQRAPRQRHIIDQEEQAVINHRCRNLSLTGEINTVRQNILIPGFPVSVPVNVHILAIQNTDFN